MTNHEQLTEYLESYRDGSIDQDGARKLVLAIQSGGDDREWVLKEMALIGWIGQAFENLDHDSFVRSFLERLYAERSETDFTTVFGQRMKGTRRQSAEKQVAHKPRLWDLLFAVRNHGEGEAAAPTRVRWLPVFGLAVILLGIGGVAVVVSKIADRPPPEQPLATLMESSVDVLVRHDGEDRSATAGMELWGDDTINVPAGGRALVTCGVRRRFTLGGSTVVTVEPRGAAVPVPTGAAALLLSGGELVGEHQSAGGDDAAPVLTPHAVARPEDGTRFALTVTPTSTRLEVAVGVVYFTRNFDGQAITVPAGYYAVATEGAVFEARRR